jgi:hypothetical protein
MVDGESRDKSLTKILEYITLGPAIVGTISALGVLMIQAWRWLHTGEWEQAPLADFLPRELVVWALAKEGGMLGVKRIVLTLLSLHASLWFFAGGILCTLLLYEMAKPVLKNGS